MKSHRPRETSRRATAQLAGGRGAAAATERRAEPSHGAARPRCASLAGALLVYFTVSMADDGWHGTEWDGCYSIDLTFGPSVEAESPVCFARETYSARRGQRLFGALAD